MGEPKKNKDIQAPYPGSWWNNEKNELIQVVSDDSLLIETVYEVNYKYWDGPNINQVTGCTIDDFYSKWNHKFG